MYHHFFLWGTLEKTPSNFWYITGQLKNWQRKLPTPQLSIQHQDHWTSQKRYEWISLCHKCTSLFGAIGVDICGQNIDVAHCIPTRYATPGPWAVICKFTRKIAKKKVINARKDAYKVLLLLLDCQLKVQWKELNYLTISRPKSSKRDLEKFPNKNGFKFCGSKNFIVYLRQSETTCPIPIKSRKDLEAFARQGELPLS